MLLFGLDHHLDECLDSDEEPVFGVGAGIEGDERHALGLGMRRDKQRWFCGGGPVALEVAGRGQGPVVPDQDTT
ncbi:hypothetical protein [Aeromicrobium sp.]